jgi:hypothetical protein
MRTTALAALLVGPAICLATEIALDGVALAIPAPEGFSPVTPEMAEHANRTRTDTQGLL